MSEIVLVTGGTGFVAGWCIVELLRRGFTVRATVRSASRDASVRAVVAAAGVSDAGLSTVVVDLLSDEGWDAAMTSCTCVLHVASPMGGGAEPSDPDELIRPAREGALRVLRAAQRAGVKRVVMTSSLAACTPPQPDGIGDESVWTNADDPKLTAYRRSKVLAERAAWDHMAENRGTTTLTTLLPGAIFGPVLRADQGGSVEVIGRMLAGKPPALAPIGVSITDVRDLAAMHVEAMGSPEAAGQRFLIVGDFLWMHEIAATLRAELGADAAKVPTRQMPAWAVRLLAMFMPPLGALVPLLGRSLRFSSDKARTTLGYAPRPARETVLACAASLVAARR